MHPRIYGTNESTEPALHRYHLTAVLIHNGQSASSGHYVGMHALAIAYKQQPVAILIFFSLFVVQYLMSIEHYHNIPIKFFNLHY